MLIIPGGWGVESFGLSCQAEKRLEERKYEWMFDFSLVSQN